MSGPAELLAADERQLLALAEDLERQGRLLPGMASTLVALLRRLGGQMVLEGVSEEEAWEWMRERGQEIADSVLADGLGLDT